MVENYVFYCAGSVNVLMFFSWQAFSAADEFNRMKAEGVYSGMR